MAWKEWFNDVQGIVVALGGVGTGGGGFFITGGGEIKPVPPRTPKLLSKLRDVEALANTATAARRIADEPVRRSIVDNVVDAENRVAAGLGEDLRKDLSPVMLSFDRRFDSSRWAVLAIWLGPGEGGDGGGIGITPGGNPVPVGPWDPLIAAHIRELYALAELAKSASRIADVDLRRDVEAKTAKAAALKIESTMDRIWRIVASASDTPEEVTKPEPNPWKQEAIDVIVLLT